MYFKAIVALSAVIAELLLPMLVAIVEDTAAIRVSRVAEVAALALVSARTDTELIRVSRVADVPALAYVRACSAAIAELFAAIETLAIDKVAETVLILLVNAAEVDAKAVLTPAMRASKVEETLAMLVAIVADTPAIRVSNVAEVPALAYVLPSPKILLIEVIASLLTVMAEAFAVMEVDSVLICVALI